MKVRLTFTEEDQEHLSERANARSKTVSVDREALMRLLVDHGNLLAAMPEVGVEGITNP